MINAMDAIIDDDQVTHKMFWRWMHAHQAAKSVKSQPFVDAGLTGKAIGDKIREEQIKRIKGVLK